MPPKLRLLKPIKLQSPVLRNKEVHVRVRTFKPRVRYLEEALGRICCPTLIERRRHATANKISSGRSQMQGIFCEEWGPSITSAR